MTPLAARIRPVIGSGWSPVAAIGVAISLCLHQGADIGWGDQVRFLGYLAGWVILPGTLLWTRLDRGERRPLVEDLAVGTLVGYVLEFPVYLALLWIGHPRWYLLWPVVALSCWWWDRRRRSAGGSLARPPRPRLGARWSWTVALLMGYVVLWYARHAWGPSPVSGPTANAPYVDLPYHLSVVASLKRDFPADVLFVDDTGLDYHFLSHLHLAAGSWVSGVEPWVLLAGLALPVAVLAVLLALATIGTRLGGTWAGPIALAGVLVVPADLSGGRDGAAYSFLDPHLLTSPSAAFVNVGLLLGVFLVISLLRGALRGPGIWALTGLTFLAMCGQKVTSLPVVLSGLTVVTLLALVRDRRQLRVPLALLALGLLAFAVARVLFFGGSAHGLFWDPGGHFGIQARRYPGLLGDDGTLSAGVELLVMTSLTAWISLLAGLAGLLSRRGHRRPDHVFLVILSLAGFGATYSFHQVGYSEGYFLVGVQVPLMLGLGLGLSRIAPMLGQFRLRTALWSISLAALLVALVMALDDPGETVTGSPAGVAVRVFVIPSLAVAAAWAMAVVLSRLRLRPDRPRLGAIALLAAVGLGLAPTAADLPGAIADPLPAARPTTRGLIGSGGIEAARWLRDHAGRDEMIATNAHCTRPPRAGRQVACRPLNFWMAGFSERQFLVEGWGFVSRTSAGLPAPRHEDVVDGPFWDPARLARNDAFFATPSPAAAAGLRRRYGVRWLLVDRRYPADLAGLRATADVRLRSGDYTVFRLR